MPDVATLLAEAVAALGGTERAGQVRMAEAVARAIRTGEHLAVQAGTGTGKSLAYLVPAIRHAVERGETVVVATATPLTGGPTFRAKSILSLGGHWLIAADLRRHALTQCH